MQQKITLSNSEFERISYAVKLYKKSAFKAPEIALNYMNYIYNKSNIEEALWVTEARKKLKSLIRCIK